MTRAIVKNLSATQESVIGGPDQEWVVFADDDRTWWWQFDVTFLLSSWRCIYGRGCPGAFGKPAHGCCDSGVWLEPSDIPKLDRRAAELGADEWQLKPVADREGFTQEDGKQTLVHEGACVFLNREGFAGGTGCALHIAAVNRGEAVEDWKPWACWFIPLWIDTDPDEQLTTIRAYTSGDWGETEPDWWCVGSDKAVGDLPVYRAMQQQLERTVGTQMYARVRAYLDERTRCSKTSSSTEESPRSRSVLPSTS